MIVCVCKNDNESKIRELLSKDSLETVMKNTGICTNCCSCKNKIQQIIIENALEKCHEG